MAAPGTFGRILKRLRDERGLTQTELARRAGVGRDFVAKLETGKLAEPTFERAVRFARALRVSISIFAGARTAEVEKMVRDFQSTSTAKAFAEEGHGLTDDDLDWLRWLAASPPFEGRMTPKLMGRMIRVYREHPELRRT